MSDRTTLVSLLRERASRQPDRIAYTFLSGKWGNARKYLDISAVRW